MAQHDYVLDNQSGAEFRQDLNNALLAIVSQNSGATAPTTTYAYMLWADTANGQLKQRNAANTDWVVLQELDGTLLMENGSAAAPGLAFASDTNTGFYRPAADKLGISTGGTSRIVIDDSGQVLLGTTSGAWGSRAVIFGDTTLGTANPDVTFAYGSANPTDDTVLANINFTNSTNVTPGAVIRVAADGNWGSYQPSRIEFHVGSSSATADEAMRIDSEGRVGVGTTGPGFKLDCRGEGFFGTDLNNGIRFNPSAGVGGANYIQSGVNGAAGPLHLGNWYGSGFMVIDGSGRVGIGTSSPSYRLHVEDNSTGIQQRISSSSASGTTLSFVNTAANGRNYRIGSNFITGNGEFALYDDTASASRIFVNSSGSVGVGTTSPSRQFSLGDANPTATFRSTSTTGQCTLFFGDSDSDARGAITYENNGDKLGLWSAGGQKLTIDSSGNVGINTTSPASTLHVVGTGRFVGNQNLLLDGATGTYSTWYYNGTPVGDIGTANTTFSGGSNTDFGITARSTTSLVFGVNSAERARITSSGQLLVGTSSARSNVATVTPGFQIEGLTNNSNRYAGFIYNAADVGGPEIHFAKSRGTAIGSNTVVADGDQIGTINFEGADGTNFIVGAQIRAFVDGTPGVNDMPGRLVFSTCPDSSATPVERMRIDNQGQLLTFFASGSNGMTARSASAAGTTYFLYRGMNSGTDNTTGGNNVFYVYTNGNVQNTNNSYAGISDIKLKENIVDAGSQWSDIKAIQVRKYNFKEETGQPTHTQIGLIAQEVELVSPGVVFESPDRDAEGNDLGTVTKSVNYSVLYMKAVKALQEAMERIETLEAKVAALESA